MIKNFWLLLRHLRFNSTIENIANIRYLLSPIMMTEVNLLISKIWVIDKFVWPKSSLATISILIIIGITLIKL